MFEALWNAVSLAAALALLAFILASALRLHAQMWRKVSAHYRETPASTAIVQKLEVAIFTARNLRAPAFRNSAFRKYAGLLLAAHDDGLALSLLPPFNLMCPPLLLPFDEMDLKPTDWALWSDPYAIRMRQLPDVDIIIGGVTVRWLREHIDQAPFGLGA